MNQIQFIKPYRYLEHWVFDDPAVGLDKEPFVMGMGEIISAILGEKGIRNADEGFFAYFSAAPMPGAEQLHWLREESGGNWYRWRDMEGWLCPALFRYFDTAPPVIHIRAAQAS